ncbi:MAG: hypothetical protein WC601_08435 [Desulfotomaculaceae bacterium]
MIFVKNTLNNAGVYLAELIITYVENGVEFIDATCRLEVEVQNRLSRKQKERPLASPLLASPAEGIGRLQIRIGSAGQY